MTDINIADHLLHYRPGSEGYGTWRLECLDGVCPQESWIDKAWPDRSTCRCTQEGNDCQACHDGDHGACGWYGRYFEEAGWECRCEHLSGPGGCWTITWMEECGADCMFGDDWPEDVLPLPVTARWNGDGLELRYASSEAVQP